MMDPYVFLGYNRVDMNALLVILTLIFVAVLIAVNIYILRLYVHADDKAIGTALYCKVLIVLGSTLFQAPALLVSLDVSNGSASLNPDGLDIKSFWFFLYLVVVAFVCFLLPFALLLY
jgi:membrane protein YdbS with pleckstrin-like domain